MLDGAHEGKAEGRNVVLEINKACNSGNASRIYTSVSLLRASIHGEPPCDSFEIRTFSVSTRKCVYRKTARCVVDNRRDLDFKVVLALQ